MVRRKAKIVAATTSVAWILLGCSPVIFTPAPQTVVYDCAFFMNELVFNVHEARVAGTRVFDLGTFNNHSCRPHEFFFDDPWDEFELIVTDLVGIRIGEAYPIRLTVYDSAGQPRYTRILTVENDTITPVIYTNRFWFKISGGDHPVPNGFRLGGLYKIEQTDRRIQAKLKFRVSNTVTRWKGQCGSDCR